MWCCDCSTGLSAEKLNTCNKILLGNHVCVFNSVEKAFRSSSALQKILPLGVSKVSKSLSYPPQNNPSAFIILTAASFGSSPESAGDVLGFNMQSGLLVPGRKDDSAVTPFCKNVLNAQ